MLAVLVLPMGQSRADEPAPGHSIFDVLSDVPALKQGIAFSIADSNVNYLATTDVFTKYGVALEVGYAGHAKDTGDKLVAVLSYDLFKAADYTTMPIIKFLEFRPGIWAGVGRVTGSNEFDYGVSASVLNVKF